MRRPGATCGKWSSGGNGDRALLRPFQPLGSPQCRGMRLPVPKGDRMGTPLPRDFISWHDLNRRLSVPSIRGNARQLQVLLATGAHGWAGAIPKPGATGHVPTH